MQSNNPIYLDLYKYFCKRNTIAGKGLYTTHGKLHICKKLSDKKENLYFSVLKIF